MEAILILNTFHDMVNHAEDTKMLLDVPSSMNNVINDQFVFNLIEICLDSTLQILHKSFLCFAEIWKIDCSKFARIWPVKFQCSTLE